MGLATAPTDTRPIAPSHIRRRVDRLRPRHWYVTIPFAYTALTIVMLWPLIRHVGSAVADTIGDPLLNAWTLRWVQHALIANPSHLNDGNIFAPNPRTLAFSELLLPQAIMAWPIWLMSYNALVAYNTALLITYPLCAVAMYALCRSLGAVRVAAFVAGICYAFAPFRMDNNAHLQVLSMQWMPLAILAVIRYVQRPSRLRGCWVTLAVAATAFSSVYYMMMFGVALVVFLLVEGIRQRRLIVCRSLWGLLVALSVAGAVVAVIDLPYGTMRREQGIVRTLDEAYDDAAHVGSYVTVTPGNHLWGHLLLRSGTEHAALFPRAILTLFALVGLRALRKPWMGGLFALGLVALVLSFGPTFGDKETGRPLPYRLLYEHIVGFKGIRGPDRFASVVLLAMAPFAAIGITHLLRSWGKMSNSHLVPSVALGAIIGAFALIETSAALLPTVHVAQSAEIIASYQWLNTHPTDGSVAEFPVASYQLLTAFYSTYHWNPVVWGHSGFIPAPTYQLQARFVGREDFPGLDDLDVLTDMGVRRIVIHRDAYKPEELAAIRTGAAKTGGRFHLVASVGESDIYDIVPDPTAPPLNATVRFVVNPGGSIDAVLGQLTVQNPGSSARMLYTMGKIDVRAVIRDTSGGVVSRETLPLPIPAIIPRGDTDIPLSITLPREPGDYDIALESTLAPLLGQPPSTRVNVVSLSALPHLALDNLVVTSPALFTPGETVAMWVTTKDGRTIALPNTTALPDATIRARIDQLPPNAAQVVVHGKASGVELWIAPP